MNKSTTVGMMAAILTFAPQASHGENFEEKDRVKIKERIHIHGFLSQAWGVTDGNQVVGLTEDGTFDYNNLALQLRYEFTDRDSAVLQLSREHRGKSPVQRLEDEVEIDWAFYEHRFAAGTTVKLGRIPIPMGIYNQLRDVGTLLPFFNPPVSLYFDEQFANEHIDGLELGHGFALGSRWSLDIAAYAGRWQFFETSRGLVAQADAENALGAQLWLQTPLSGLRVGVGTNRYDVRRGLLRVDESDVWKNAIFSIDGDFEKVLVRAELLRRELPLALSPGINLPGVVSDSYHLQLGYRFNSRWAVYAQAERGDIGFSLPQLGTFEANFWQDYALSLHYLFPLTIASTDTLVNLKIEWHDNEGYLVENESRSLLVDPPAETEFGLISLSISF